MKSRAFIFNLFVLIVVSIFLFSCSNSAGTPKKSNDFIQHFLDQNAERIYKSEIQRVKVNFFPASGMLVYSFWKKEKFDSNGKLFLHLYPNDTSKLIEHRRKHGFINLPMDNTDGMIQAYAPYFYQFHNLQLPYDLSSIQTGQYNDTSKTWKSDFKNKMFLKKSSRVRLELLKEKNTSYAVSMFAKEESVPFLGSKIYNSQNNDLVIFYNATLNRVSLLSKEINKSHWKENTMFIDIYGDVKEPESNRLTFDALNQINEIGFSKLDIPLDESFDRLEIVREKNGQETILRTLENEVFIHSSFPLKSSNEGPEQLNSIDNEIEIVTNLIASNIPLVYVQNGNKLGLFFNKHRNTAYIISNVEDFDDLKLRSMVIENSKSREKEIVLENSFYLKGEKKLLVVHELRLPKNASSYNLKLFSGEEELFVSTIEIN